MLPGVAILKLTPLNFTDATQLNKPRTTSLSWQRRRLPRSFPPARS